MVTVIPSSLVTAAAVGLLAKQGWCFIWFIFYIIFHPGGGEEVLQLVLPTPLRSEMLTQLHQDHGHQGIERTLQLVRQQCYWPEKGFGN